MVAVDNKVDAGSESNQDDDWQVMQLNSELVQNLQLQSHFDHLDKVKDTNFVFISIVLFILCQYSHVNVESNKGKGQSNAEQWEQFWGNWSNFYNFDGSVIRMTGARWGNNIKQLEIIKKSSYM